MHKQVAEVNGKLSRIYKDEQCKNPNCINGGLFTPRRSNQLFCTKKCKEIYHNDLKKIINKTTYKEEIELRRIDKFIDSAYNLLVDDKGFCCIHKRVFKHHNVNTYMTLDLHFADDGKTHVHSTYRYQYYPHPSDPNFFIIKKKN
jgi:hypothetical protein